MDHSVPKVLIVDDQPRNLDALEAMLESSPCHLVRALSADEALLCLLRDDFAAIVLDIRMPGMDGIELARLIKGRKRSEHVPILFLTAHMSEEKDILQGYSAGAVDYLSKPVNGDVLRSKVGVFIDLFRKTRALAEINELLRQEVDQRERAQRAIEAANQDLERRVQERAASLARVHQEVLENEERWRMAMQVAHIAAWEWNLLSGQMTWSIDPEGLFGFPSGAFGPDLRISTAFHPDDRDRIELTVSNAIKSAGSYEAEYRAMRPDGTTVWLKERGRVVSNGFGTPERMLGITRDVTEEHEAHVERERLLRSAREARDEAERQSRLKDEFLATLSHELRTPMNVVLGWLDILASGKHVRNLESALPLIQRNAQLQARLIDDLLDMNRLIAGNMPLDLVMLDMVSLVRTTLQGLQPAAETKGIQLHVSVPPDSIEVLADNKRIQQVLWNLVHNAIKFTPSGGRIDVQLDRMDREVQLAVRDNGQGISPEFLPHVFERFRQEDSSTTRQSFGLGLGLSIAKHLVEIHGGTICGQSKGTGTGAVFIVRLPIAPASSAHIGEQKGARVTFRSERAPV